MLSDAELRWIGIDFSCFIVPYLVLQCEAFPGEEATLNYWVTQPSIALGDTRFELVTPTV